MRTALLLLGLIGLTFAAPSLKVLWEHKTEKPGYWHIGAQPAGKFFGGFAEYPAMTDFFGADGSVLYEEMNLHAWFASTPYPQGPLKNTLYAVTFDTDLQKSFFSEYRLSPKNSSVIERTFKVPLQDAYPALGIPIAVSANAGVVGVLLTNDKDRDNRTGCLYLFTLPPSDDPNAVRAAPVPVKYCVPGLLFEDAAEVHVNEDGTVIALELGFIIQVLEFNPATHALRLRWETNVVVDNDIPSLALSPRGDYLAKRHLRSVLLMMHWNATSRDYEWEWISPRIDRSVPEMFAFTPVSATEPPLVAVCWQPVSDSPAWDTWVQLYDPRSDKPLWTEQKKPSEGDYQDVCGGLVISPDNRMVAVGAWGKDDGEHSDRLRFFQGIGGKGHPLAVGAVTTTGTVFEIALVSPPLDAPLPRKYRVIAGGLQEQFYVTMDGGDVRMVELTL